MASSSTVLPPGWSVSQGRETSAQGPSGNIIRGTNFILTGPNGGTNTVFVPEALYNQPATVGQMFLQRIDAINGILNIGS
jgi:hypothetical protein